MNKSKNKEFNRIIVPVDGSDASKKAAEKSFSLADKTGLDVTLMHVVQIPEPVIPSWNQPKPQWSEEVKKQGKKMLDEIKNIGEKKGISVETKLVEGVPDDEIIKESKKEDLIVMGSKGRSAVGRVLIGSTSEKVLHHSDSTVMIVR